MKKLILFLSFLLFNSLILSFAAEKPNPVLDIDGEEIRAGVEYYIVPFFWPRTWGVTYGLSPPNEIACPLAVAQAWPAAFPLIRNGLPITFTPVNPEEGVVRLSTDLNIKFSEPGSICIQSNVWKVDFDKERGQYIILTDGVEGNPGCVNIASWFKIEEFRWSAYKLVFCPTVCNSTKVICKDVGRFCSSTQVSLGLTDEPFVMRFWKRKNILKSVTST